jgi:hypothetical protein
VTGVQTCALPILEQKGLGSTINNLLSVPLNIVEYPYKDVNRAIKIKNFKDFRIRDIETWRNVPLLGKEYYYWFGKGEEYKLKTEKENILKRYKENRGIISQEEKNRYDKINKRLSERKK